jgi:ribonuclease HI
VAASVITIYTDGSCLGNPGPGGWGWAVPDGAQAAGADPMTTNQRMEITAALEAIRAHPTGDLEIVSDSTYVVKCFQDRWWAGWQRRGWKNSQGKPVANRELWEQLLSVGLDDSRQIAFRWVKGHSGDRWNDVVDELATTAARTQLPFRSPA